ncbi:MULTISPECIES: hypothetical protein [Alphaproteobacteria]|uniref:Uncharacterized protein n=2 Tax=Alphaproteobacteria TaxID=28211 RepID=A0A512HNM7_9HYPH|nr:MULTISPECIES: hypothetical protein [Alphaproteobacteria]GEO87051.1 hypothetical protein RNA01_39830 [Ciceribacter naphthalenivorans]GLR23163.1 hypothetical protein GCM10007920_29510 [Ciceribacter naphthalenivorans]GLT06019.1 hypothetical protein GCM10007926_29510 [Sphingomonas psychrolutea]
MKLREYLSIPYILEAQPYEGQQGQWVRRLSYPELGDFSAEGQDVEQVFLEVERLRYAEIVRRLKAGDPPPVPRAPLETADPAWWANFLGLSGLVNGLLDKNANELISA